MNKTAQQKLAEASQRLEALMKALPVGITFSSDTTCEYITGNPYILKHLEMETGDNISASAHEKNIAGAKLRHFINGKQITGKDMPMQRAIAENRQIEPLEIEVELPSGKRWTMEAIGAPVYDDAGHVVASVAVNIDLTERKKAEEVNKLERLIEQEKEKIGFIADATHELRTPLAIIRGNVDLAMREKKLTSRSIRSTLQAINAEVTFLTNILSDLTLLAIKGGDFQRKMNWTEVDMNGLLKSIVERHHSFAKKKRISMSVKIAPKTTAIGDEPYMERLFSNIVSNAIYYGKKGGSVSIIGSKFTGPKGKNSVRIEIHDNGMGISKKDLPHIFDRFYRAEQSRSKDYGGSGLGLALVKWIAEAHGGTVTARSTEKKGSVFTVILP